MEAGVSVYPNPSNGSFLIELGDGYGRPGDSDVLHIAAFNAGGRLVSEFEIAWGLDDLGLRQTVEAGLPGEVHSGVYFLRIAFGERVFSEKLCVVR